MYRLNRPGNAETHPERNRSSDTRPHERLGRHGRRGKVGVRVDNVRVGSDVDNDRSQTKRR